MLFLVLALAMLTEDPAATPPPPPRAPVIQTPDWSRRPSAEDLRAAYPPDAWRDRIVGRAILACGVLETGVLADCSVVSETPAGRGFGEAALKVTGRFKMKPLSREGGPVAGARVRIPVVFPSPPLNFDEAVSCYGQLHRHNVAVPDDEMTLKWAPRARTFAVERGAEERVPRAEVLRRLEAVEAQAPAADVPFSRCWDML